MTAQPSSDLRRFEPVSDALLLAGMERAERHEQAECVLWRRIVEHVGFIPGGWTTRNLRPQVETLAAAGLVERSRRHGVHMWGLTSSGRQRLAELRCAGEVVDLPEAPQHREWRQARAEAGELIDRFRQQVRHTLEEATELLDGEHGDSDVWFGLARCLDGQCKRLGAATYCLQEWAEPDDAHADVEDVCTWGDLRHLRRARTGWRDAE
jgi:hypothetical protein